MTQFKNLRDFVTEQKASGSNYVSVVKCQHVLDIESLAMALAALDLANAKLAMPMQERRQLHLTETLAQRGWFRRADLTETFGVSIPQASTDIGRWVAENPGRACYNGSTKRYEVAL